MGESSRVPNYRPIALAKPSFFLLQLASGENTSYPLHLVLGQTGQTLEQQINLVTPAIITGTKPINELPNTTNTVEPVVDYVIPPKTKVEPTPEVSSSKPLKKNRTVQSQRIGIQKPAMNVLRHREINQKSKEASINAVIDRLQNYVHFADREVPPRAFAVLPKALHIRRNHIYPRRTLPPRARFGPVQGVTMKIYHAEADELVSEAAASDKPIFLLNKDKYQVTHINVADKERSNWISLLPLGKENTANVWIYEEDDKLYGITTKLIPSRTPLTLGYSEKYAEVHNIPPGAPVLDLEEALADHKWWCFECRRALGSAAQLLKHTKLYHTDNKPWRRKYQCKHCSRTFDRISTLRRHMIQTCRKKAVKNIIESEPKKPETDFCIQQALEDNRIPSDESFQNYTTGLDFSTNLFDPDKISNLDISGSSKSEADFSAFNTGLNNIENNDEYSKFCKGLNSTGHDKKEIKQDSEPSTVSCRNCEQTMTKSKKRRHLKECPARLLKCQCGKSFTKKEDFGKHVYTEHVKGIRKTAQNDIKEKESEIESLQYCCDICKMNFKRRGMLVNHMWRVHNSTAPVPSLRRDRHYPCALCPKIYRAASKRNRHQQKHHPGAHIRVAPIEGERRAFQPARCPACPREYSTRAKLLQHMRATHPQLSLSKKPKPPELPLEPTEDVQVKAYDLREYFHGSMNNC